MKSGPIIIEVPVAKIKISPLGFHHYGSEFLRTGRSFNKAKEGFSPVPYYLYSRAIELLLKAFLLSKGISKEELKKKKTFGHDLMKALNKARLLGIDDIVEITLEEEKEVEKTNAYYAKKEFEYFEILNTVNGYPGLPDLEVLNELASKLAEKLKQVCLNA